MPSLILKCVVLRNIVSHMLATFVDLQIFLSLLTHVVVYLAIYKIFRLYSSITHVSASPRNPQTNRQTFLKLGSVPLYFAVIHIVSSTNRQATKPFSVRNNAGVPQK
jgi:hypothetical protein